MAGGSPVAVTWPGAAAAMYVFCHACTLSEVALCHSFDMLSVESFINRTLFCFFGVVVAGAGGVATPLLKTRPRRRRCSRWYVQPALFHLCYTVCDGQLTRCFCRQPHNSRLRGRAASDAIAERERKAEHARMRAGGPCGRAASYALVLLLRLVSLMMIVVERSELLFLMLCL